MSAPALPRQLVLRAGIILELALLSIALVWAALRGFSFSFEVTAASTEIATATVLTLLFLNIFLLRRTEASSTPSAWIGEFRSFRDEIVQRLVGNLDARSAGILALLSGIAEEAFFRGALWAELAYWGTDVTALVISSTVFAAAHFGANIREYPRVTALYVFYGLVLGVLYMATGSLLVMMLSHAAYNFVAFAILTRGFSGSSLGESSTIVSATRSPSD